jgi:hypothetical protein
MIPKVFLERKCNPFCLIFSEFTQKNPMDYWLSLSKTAIATRSPSMAALTIPPA